MRKVMVVNSECRHVHKQGRQKVTVAHRSVLATHQIVVLAHKVQMKVTVMIVVVKSILEQHPTVTDHARLGAKKFERCPFGTHFHHYRAPFLAYGSHCKLFLQWNECQEHEEAVSWKLIYVHLRQGGHCGEVFNLKFKDKQ